MATYTTAAGKRATYKEASSSNNTYVINDDTKGATIAGAVNGDIIAIEGFATDFTASVSGRVITLKSTVDTDIVIKVQLANVTGATASFRFLDGDLTATKGAKITLGTQTLTSKAAAISESNTLGSNDSSATFDETSGSSGGSTTTGTTFTLTAGINQGADFVGTAGNDLFTANDAAGALTLTSLDAIDGGNGTDRLVANVVGALDTTAAVGATVTGIESATLTTAAAVTANTTAWTGLTSLQTTSIGAATVTAAATTDVTVANTAANATSVQGGKNVTVAAADTSTTGAATGDTLSVGTTTAAAGAVTVTYTETVTDAADAGIAGKILAVTGGTTITVNSLASAGAGSNAADVLTLGAVNITGNASTTTVSATQSAATAAWAAAGDNIKITNGAVTITDVNNATTTADRITTVTLANYGNSTINSSALSSLTISESGSGAAGTLALDRGAADTAPATTLALNIAGGSSVGAISGTHAADITTLNVTTTGTAAATIANATFAGATTLNVAGTAALTFTDNTFAALTAINTGASAVTFGTTAIGNDVLYTGGAGVDTFTVGATTRALTLGGGNDAVTISAAALGTGGSIDGGAGNNWITMSAANAITASATNTFESTVSNFNRLAIQAVAATGTVNLSNLDDINYINVAAVNAGRALTLSNVASGVTVEFADGTQTSTIVSLANVGAADVANIRLTTADEASTLAAIDLTGFETVNINSEDTDTNAVAASNAITALTAGDATAVVVTGNAGLALDAGFNGNTVLRSFDASAVTAGAVTYTSGALAGASTIRGGAGADTLNAAAAVAAVTLSGNGGADALTGSATIASNIDGGAGNDTLTGGAAADVITGGDGTDTFVFSSADVAEQAGSGDTTGVVINLSADALSFSAVNVATANAGFLAGGVSSVASNTSAYLFSTESQTNASVVDTLSSIENATGSNEADYIVGSAGNNVLNGGAGADTIAGGAGNDTINGGAQADSLTGGTGADDFILSSTATVDTISDFSLANLDQIGNISLADVAGIATLTTLRAATTDVAAGAVTTATGDIGAAFDLGGVAAGANLLLATGNYASAAAVQVAIRANALAGTATTAAEGFLIAWDNGTNTSIGVVDYQAIEADGDAIDAATVTLIATLSGVADATTLTTASGAWLAFVA